MDSYELTVKELEDWLNSLITHLTTLINMKREPREEEEVKADQVSSSSLPESYLELTWDDARNLTITKKWSSTPQPNRERNKTALFRATHNLIDNTTVSKWNCFIWMHKMYN